MARHRESDFGMTLLEGRVALITGGSRGIGAAVAKRLARDGASISFTYANSSSKAGEVAHAIEASGQKALAIHADSGDVDAVKGAIAQTAERWGRIDILVNNAGISIPAPIDQYTLEDFDRLIAVNVRGTFVATQEALRHMGDGGRIIMIGSVNSDHIPFPQASVYALSKGAIAGFTRGLARDLGPRGITVNTVQPGPIETDMNPAESPYAHIIKGMTALGRFGTGEEIASLVSYLAGPDAAFVTGAGLIADGGFSA
jgi:3-oxoacyl-[acyl-carrier protein] reductase